MINVNSASMNEIPHWVCIGCGAIQPKPATDPYPDKCWRCNDSDFIRDVLEYPQKASA